MAGLWARAGLKGGPGAELVDEGGKGRAGGRVDGAAWDEHVVVKSRWARGRAVGRQPVFKAQPNLREGGVGGGVNACVVMWERGVLRLVSRV